MNNLHEPTSATLEPVYPIFQIGTFNPVTNITSRGYPLHVRHPVNSMATVSLLNQTPTDNSTLAILEPDHLVSLCFRAMTPMLSLISATQKQNCGVPGMFVSSSLAVVRYASHGRWCIHVIVNALKTEQCDENFIP
jgi:hypothetical protein